MTLTCSGETNKRPQDPPGCVGGRVQGEGSSIRLLY